MTPAQFTEKVFSVPLSIKLPVFFIEGNFGVGESTLIRKSAERNPTWSVFYEPVEFWNQDYLLDRFYVDPTAVAFQLQCRIFESYQPIYAASKASQVSQPTTPILIERSARSAFHVFSELSLTANFLSYCDHQKLHRTYHSSFYNCDLHAQSFYLQSRSDSVFSRMISRVRLAEVRYITPDYLTKLSQQHEEEFNSSVSDFKASHMISDTPQSQPNDLIKITQAEDIIRLQLRLQ